MDSSITRRGAPCWYKAEGVGMVAVNDSFIVESIIFRLLRKYFKGMKCYGGLLDLFHEVDMFLVYIYNVLNILHRIYAR